MDTDLTHRTRRDFVLRAAGAGAGLLLTGCAARPPARPEPPAPTPPKPPAEPGVGPIEDLMREHGVVARLLLVYEECARRLDAHGAAPVDVLARTANLVRRFVEDYHEKLEEKYVFPRFERAGRWVELVATLRAQHEAGRRLTDDVLRLATPAHMRGTGNRRRLADTLGAYARMYRPHAAREDTVLLPDFRRLVGASDYAEMGRTFEERERTLLGALGFERMVDEVAGLERAVGIHDLARFTPAPSPQGS